MELLELNIHEIEDIEPRSANHQEVAKFLQSDITVNKIIEALSAIPDDKTQGNDRFTSHFFKVTWRIIRHEFTRASHNFFKYGKMIREVNATCITLVPKVPNPASLVDY